VVVVVGLMESKSENDDDGELEGADDCNVVGAGDNPLVIFPTVFALWVDNGERVLLLFF
jgi:hypothetical protein